MNIMRRVLLVFACFAICGLGLFAPGIARSQSPAALQYYSGGEGALTITSLASQVDYTLPLSGRTTKKTLMMSITKKGGAQKRLALPLDKNGNFNVVWLFKDGPGTYEVVFFGSAKERATKYDGIAFTEVRVKAKLPANFEGLNINRKIIAFVDSHMGQKVGTGECWDLAQEALEYNLADWERPVTFGRLLDPQKDTVLPGDIIQFKSVTITTKTEQSTRVEKVGAPDHTAVVYEVKGKLHYMLAHQNLGGVKKVKVTEMNLGNTTAGQYWIWRPSAAAIKK